MNNKMIFAFLLFIICVGIFLLLPKNIRDVVIFLSIILIIVIVLVGISYFLFLSLIKGSKK